MTTRYVIYPSDRRDVHDIESNRVAKFPDPETAAQATDQLNAGDIDPECFVWNDYAEGAAV